MAIWDDVISERDKRVYAAGGFGAAKMGFGDKPALVIIDVNYNFVGDKPEPILESIKRYPMSCGEEGWAAVHQIASLLPLARAKRIPIIYSNSDPKRLQVKAGLKPWLPKQTRTEELAHIKGGLDIVKEIAPAEEDIIIYKWKASIFLGTPLLGLLNAMRVDTLLCCGCVTSGCVRASVVDASSYNFKVSVIEECTFDRFQISHKINLFDLNAKYADVVSLAEVKEYLSKL